VFETDKKARKENNDVKQIAVYGRPFFVHIAKKEGACPLNANPYKIRDAANRKELPAEKAEVKTQALIMWGRTLTPALLKAMTYGDWAAVPELRSRLGSL